MSTEVSPYPTVEAMTPARKREGMGSRNARQRPSNVGTVPSRSRGWNELVGALSLQPTVDDVPLESPPSDSDAVLATRHML
mmetsp:Transcript_22156/g.52355  ORF Transcript_22156/g.52355 Transcript_22156/m.52355 type:complete len:81 (-) Transcript_22156:542-784(-)